MKENYRVLWLGSYMSSEMFEQMPAKHIGLASGYASQKGLIKGIDKVLPNNIIMDTIGGDSVTCFPKNPLWHIKRQEWKRNPTTMDSYVGFLNLKYLNYFSRFFSLRNEIINWEKARLKKDEKMVCFVYGIDIAKLEQVKLLKKTGARIYVIIPDVPEYVNQTASKFDKKLKAIIRKEVERLFSLVDGFILYSEYMAAYYGLQKNQWILIEGVFDTEEASLMTTDFKKKLERHKTIIMYSGALTKARGIPQLLDAFDEMHDRQYELWITGGGSLEELVKERAQKDNRIIFYGYLDRREDVISLQQKADILVHTRDTESLASTYCFPSKLFEYMASGRPILSIRIPGIPDEYYQYMTTINDLNVDTIVSAIKKIVNENPETVQDRCNRAREYVINYKSETSQAKKILEFASITVE